MPPIFSLQAISVICCLSYNYMTIVNCWMIGSKNDAWDHPGAGHYKF
jgi:hypothetical protein